MQQCCTVNKMVGQHAQGNMCPREAFPHCHAYAAQNSATDEQGQRAKGILKGLQSDKFLKYLDLMMAVTKVLSTLSKTFHGDELCITDVVTTLETTLTPLN